MITTESYLLLIIVWIAWCGLHSALICVPVTDHFERVLGANFRFYRLAYNLISIATLAVPAFLLSAVSLALPVGNTVRIYAGKTHSGGSPSSEQ